MTPENIDPLLDAQAAVIDAMAAAALVDLLALMADGVAPDKAVTQVLDTFNGAFETQLQRALTRVLGRSVTARQVAVMPVGGLPLSARLYAQAARTSLEVEVLVRQHAAGMHDARALAIRLYDGYSPKDGVQRPLEARSMAKLPKPLRELMRADIKLKGSYEQLLAEVQAAAARLKTGALKAAYTEAIDQWAKGKGQEALERKLDVAFKEKTRYHANRIAQTELARAHQDKVGAELMLDDSISVVQIVMAPKHPLADICDFHAKADLFGLGKGCYPKAKAPKPTFHPFCRCIARSRPDLSAVNAREVPGGVAAHLRKLPPSDAARVAGSMARLQDLLNGADLDAVINVGKNPAYHLSRLGQLDLSIAHPDRVPLGMTATGPMVGPLTTPAAPVFSPPKTVADFILAGKAITASMPDGALDARACHAALVDLLRREVGTASPCKVASTGAGAALVKQASQLYPDSWTIKADQFGPLYTKSGVSTRGHSLTTQEPPIYGDRYKLKDFGVVTYEKNAGYIMARTGSIGNALHEYAHRLQKALPALDALFQELHRKRTRNDPLKMLKNLVPGVKYGNNEIAREDHYFNPYQGKEYANGAAGGAVEVLTMGFETVLGVAHGNSKSRMDFERMYTMDREMFDFVVGVLRHWTP